MSLQEHQYLKMRDEEKLEKEPEKENTRVSRTSSEESVSREERSQLCEMPKVKLENYRKRTIGLGNVGVSDDLGSNNFGAFREMKMWLKFIQLEGKSWRW